MELRKTFSLVLVGLILTLTLGPQSVRASSSVTNITNPDGHACSEPGFITFENLSDGTSLSVGNIGGVQFTTTGGFTWLVGDFDTGLYNGKYPNGGYTSEGTHWAWLGPNQGTGRIDFVNGPASSFSLLASVNSSAVSVDAYGANDAFLERAGPSAINYGTGHMDELKITRQVADIAYVLVHDTGNFFEVDAICTDAGTGPVVVLDPGHGQILQDDVLQYQRSPSPTYGVIEDILTLDIAASAKADLEASNIGVYLTRTTSRAPFAPPNCGNPCFADLNKRVRWAEKQEADLMVSIHTNGSDTDATANGSESFYSTVAPSPDSSSLAGFVLARVVALGLRDRHVQQKNYNIINTSMASALIEVAFHSNSQLATGQTITDEARLNDPAFRSGAARAISDGIQEYYATKSN